MLWKRNLRYGMSGPDVRQVKELLLSQGYYSPNIAAINRDRFGTDTLAAVKYFQRTNRDAAGRRLAVDGVVGPKTYEALAGTPTERPRYALPEHIGAVAARAISEALETVSESRRQTVLQSLEFAVEPERPGAYPRSLYIWGGNLYGTDLKQNIITKARIETGAKKNPGLYSGGRKDMMKAAVERNPMITGADCSGGIVGLLRVQGLVRPNFDATADTLTGSGHSAGIAASSLRPGDFVGRSGHIGLYAGAGYVVEWMGGANGCQLNRLTDRKGYDYVAGRIVRKSKWTKYRRPYVY